MRLRKSAMVFMIFLMFVSGLLPSASSLQVQALEGSTLEEPNVSKDVEGEESKEVQKGENHQYNVNVELPQNLEGYETVAILNEVDNRLTVQEISLLVDNQEVEVEKVDKEEEQDTEGLRVLVDEQGILLELNQDQLDEFADKEIKLQITAQVKEDAPAGESIESIAKVLINDSEEIETNSVVVTPIDTEASEEDKEVVEETGAEETKEDDKDTIEVAEEKKEDAEEPKKESKKETKSKEASAKSKELTTVQPQNTEGITINDTDQYAITHVDFKIWHIVQYDGNNVSAGPKAKVALDDQSSVTNAIALGKNEDVIYGVGNYEPGINNEPGKSNLYKVYPDGTTEFVTELVGTPAAATISQDGTKYVYEVMVNGVLNIAMVDLNTLETELVEINDKTGFSSLGGGDLAFDADGNLWFARWWDKAPNFRSVLAKIDLNTGEMLSTIPLVTDTGENYSRAGALSFLPNGKILSYGIYEEIIDNQPRTPYFFELDPGTGIAKEIIADIGGSQDFASRAYPSIKPDLNIEKTNDPSDDVTLGDEITYTLKVTNTGNLASTFTTIQDELPEGVSYRPNSTTLNGETIADVNGTSPIFTGMLVKSPNEDLDGVVYTGEQNAAVVTFKVTVNSELPFGTEIINIATVTADGVESIPSNEVINKVVPKDPKLESTKSWELEKKAEGNTDEANPEVGDTIRYTITTKNTIEDSLVENLVITDTIPEGLTYVVGSLEVDGESVTDEADDDAGHVIDGQVTGNFGDITDTEEHFVTFLVTVDEGQAGKDIKNIATVDGDNVDEPDEPEEEVKVYPRDPVLEAEKSVVNLDTDKETFEVGDTVVYTIMTRNTVSDSQASNMTAVDEIPEGLEYVEGSLVVSHEGTGTFEDGVITVSFGDVTDTEWRTVSFQAKVLPGQSEKEIENVAQVTIDETDEPEEPSTKVKIEPKDPEIESDKSSEIHEKLEGNTDEENVEVGDTLLYTIQSRNTIEDSKVTNYVITDVIPEGLEYVEGSLKVDGESVTDNKDDDKGHLNNGIVTGEFGDVTDTEWHTLEFLVVVKEGQAGKDIKNIATVDGDNLDEPNEPEDEVRVYPRNPVLESEKSATNLEEDKEKFEVGDTVVYTIKTRNTISDSSVEGLTIIDNLPAGLEYVSDSLIVDGESVTDAEDGDKGHYVDGTVAAQFGDVTDTEWHTVVFHAKVKAGQAEKTIENTAISDGDNVDEPEESTTTIIVDPKDPEIESEKSAEIYEKLESNTDEDNPEVGDTLLYTIQTRNTVEDSIIKNLVITDKIPEGLEYVEGSIVVDGEAVSDAEDDDSGHMVEGTVEGQFGDIRDTDWHTLEFLVVVGEGQAGADIKNVASVEGDNTTTDEPEEEVKIYPRESKIESEKTAENLDKDKERFEVGDTVVYTIKARNTVSDSEVKNLIITDELIEGLEYVEGSLTTDPEAHATFEDGIFTANFGDVKDTEWRTMTFHAEIKVGQAGNELKNIATVEGEDVPPTHPEDSIKVEPKKPNLESEKSSTLEEKARGNTEEESIEVGDTIRYTVTAKNTIEDSLVENMVITDEIPEGLAYVADSLKVDGESVTDAEDSDKGHHIEGTVTGQFGDITDTDWHTLEFLVTVEEGQAGRDIKNIATVDGDNIDEPDKPEEEVIVYPREPKLDSKKESKNKDELKEKFEVGDTIVYTIKTRNEVSDSLVENLKITDELPAGLEYVEGSLNVSHDGEGTFNDRTITATFGDVTDTEWRTVTFEAKIKAGQSGKQINNTAKVEGNNVEEPDEPAEEVTVDPKDPKPHSEKTSKIHEKADGNTDEDNPEVGDTLLYTIKTKNTIADSLIKNLVITDDIPEGLAYVADSLKVDGESVTDAEDSDKGHHIDGTITGQFGDITDTDWHTLEFLVTVEEGQAGKDIKNIATVDGDNIDEPDKPEEEIIVYPREPKLDSKKESKNKDADKQKFEVGDTIVYTIKTRNEVSDSVVENLKITDVLPAGLEYVEGSLNISHGGEGTFNDGTITATFGDVKDTEWRTVTFEAKIKAGQSGKEIENIATVDGDNVDKPDKPKEKVTVDPKAPKLESDKSAANTEKGKEKFEVGDTIVYTIKARSKESDSLVENLTIADKLPAGLEYVEGSLKVNHEGTGEFIDGTIIANFGDVTDTEWRIVTFKATIQSGHFGESIKNIAEVSGDNVPDPSHPEAKIEVEPKDPEPTPKDPTPAPDQDDDQGVKTPPSDTDKGDGKKLPNTATNLFNYGLIGIIAILAGGLLALRRRKSNSN